MRPLAMHRGAGVRRAQVWISFVTAAALCAVGLAWLPARELDRALTGLGFVLCLTTALALARFIRDNESRTVTAPLLPVIFALADSGRPARREAIAIAIAVQAGRSVCAAYERG